MERGFVKQWRKEMESEIWEMPPLYFKVWRYLLMTADYKTGVWKGTYNSIANGVRWTENHKEITPSKSQIREIITFLNRLTATSQTASHLRLTLTIVNWGTYQSTNTQPPHTQEDNRLTPASHPSNYIERAQKKLRSKEVPEKTSTTNPIADPCTEGHSKPDVAEGGGFVRFPQTQNQTPQTTPQPDPQHAMPVPDHTPAQISAETYETVAAISGRIGTTGIPQTKYLRQLNALVDEIGPSRAVQVVDESIDDIHGANNAWAYIVAIIKNNKTPKPKANKCAECGTKGIFNKTNLRNYKTSASCAPRWVGVPHYECPKCKHREAKGETPIVNTSPDHAHHEQIKRAVFA